VDDQHPADVLHRLGSRARAYLLEHALAPGAVRARHPYLDQLVALERALDLLKHGLRQSGVADHDDRI
jgi:hypothetical protein